jgi:hypothetical protein
MGTRVAILTLFPFLPSFQGGLFMFQRVPVLLVFAVLAGVLALSADASAPGGREKGEAGHHKVMFRKCAEACHRCQRECISCGHHCAELVAEGKRDHLKTLRSCQDCATICAAAAQIVSREGPYSGIMCKACAEACDKCERACREFREDRHMKECAEECRHCEKECREMLRHVGFEGGRGKDFKDRD